MTKITENEIEKHAIELLEHQGYAYHHGPVLAPGSDAPERATFEGKAMIVAMSRRIAAALYEAIVALRPDWHDDDLKKGAIKVIMTSASSDGPKIAKHHTTKDQRRLLADRMKDPDDPLKLCIVRDMWLTGFDLPCLHTLYIDKPMMGHNLMQAIARVNRVYWTSPTASWWIISALPRI